MSLVVKISLDPASQRYLARLAEAPAQAQRALLRTIDRENQLTIGAIQQERLSKRGPDTLGVITNRLRSSIRASKAVLAGDGGITSAIGSNVVYAGVHEFGFDGDVIVRAHTRRVYEFARGAATKITFDMKTGRIKRGKVIRRKTTGEVAVRSHSRHMRMPPRAYIRRTIERRQENYRVAIGGTVARLLGGSSSS